MLSIVRPTINVVSLRQGVSSVILPPLGTRTDFAGCLQWNEPEVSGHVTMDAVSGTRPAKAEGAPSFDAQRSDSTSRCGSTIFLGRDDRCASVRTKLVSRPNTAGRDLSNSYCRLILEDPTSECCSDQPLTCGGPREVPLLSVSLSHDTRSDRSSDCPHLALQ